MRKSLATAESRFALDGDCFALERRERRDDRWDGRALDGLGFEPVAF